MAKSLGKSVWIIGASSGIGASIAEVLAEQSATDAIFVSGRREAELAEVVKGCQSANPGITVIPVPMDVTDLEMVQSAYAVVQDTVGVPDVVVYSTGVSQRALALDTNEAVDRRVMEVNYFGATRIARLVVSDMARNGRGKFLVVSSVAGKFGTPLRSSYAASKHALHGYFDCLRAEVHESGVQVSVVCPGYIQTNLTMNSLVGDGSAYGKVDLVISNGLHVRECAAAIIDTLEKGRDEVVISHLREKVGVLISRLFPGLMRKMARGMTEID